MKPHADGVFARLVLIGLATATLLGRASPAVGEDSAAVLVDAAMRAERAGDHEDREALLREAAEKDADHAATRWHSGMVRVGDEWLAVPQAVDRALSSKVIAEYADRRLKADASLKDQSALARWCEANGLEGKARAHWSLALSANPNNRAAQDALGLTNVDGELVPVEVAANGRVEPRERDLEELRERFVRLRRRLLSGDAAEARNAEEEIAGVSDPSVVAAMIDALAAPADDPADTERLHGLLVEALGRVPQPWATNDLVNQALGSRFESVRRRALELLKAKPLVETAPLLLARMSMPMELSVSTRLDPRGRMVSTYEEYREGPAGNDYENSYGTGRYVYGPKFRLAPIIRTQKVRDAYTTEERVIPGGYRTSCSGGRRYFPTRVIPAQSFPAVYADRIVGVAYSDETPEYYYRANQAYNDERQKARYAYASMSKENQRAEAYNVQVAEVLEEVSGESVSGHARSAWEWWQQRLDNNGDEREADRLSIKLGLVARRPPGLPDATTVWTRTGQRPIAQIAAGDEVLAQNPATGELSFKPVLLVITIDGGSMTQVTMDQGGLAVAQGQWLWQTDKGWRLARDLDKGSLLHGHTGSRRVAGRTDGASPVAIALVVDGFHTFFAGEPSVLLHDATDPKPTDAAIPGWED